MFFEIVVRKRLGETAIAVDFRSDALVTALTGPSGAGKTSLLNMVAGILKPDSGRIAVGGRLLFDADRGVDLAPEQRRCGYVFQEGRLFPHMNVRANLLYGSRRAPSDRSTIGYAEAVEVLGIAPLTERRPSTLSGGEARRVAIGRALLSGADFLLLDEPLTSIDLRRREELLATIERVRDQFGLPILYVSHDPDEVGRLAGAVVNLAPAPADRTSDQIAEAPV
ncbi:MAG: ATP-binding cassette domain-containing protein [Allosphingosinicella sp.]